VADPARRVTQTLLESEHLEDRAQRFTQLLLESEHLEDQAQRFTQVLVEVDVGAVTGVFTNGVAMPEYKGDARGIPVAGDRSAWEVDDYPEKHASDLNDEEPRYHNPWPMADGEAAVSDGDKLVATDVATQAELDAHEGAANPHSTTVDDLDDVSAAAPDDEDVLLWNMGASEWQPSSVVTHVWEPLTNGDASSPELVFADGDVVMVETED